MNYSPATYGAGIRYAIELSAKTLADKRVKKVRFTWTLEIPEGDLMQIDQAAAEFIASRFTTRAAKAIRQRRADMLQARPPAD